jgi:MoxR-like ATPase
VSKAKKRTDAASMFERLDSDEPVRLVSEPGIPEQVHVFDDPRDRSRLAVKSALAAGRPLLVRGEPGVGKTQLAAATAKALGRPLVSCVVNARTESTDLLWHFDSVRRLAEAQVCGVLGLTAEQLDQKLHVTRFVEPGPLWWGFDWNGAKMHAEAHGFDVPPVGDDVDPDKGRVVLIDEIDKADSDLPNGLLEALGSGRFTPQGCPTVAMSDPAPLVIVTTNEERVLPDAFIRRCLVLHLSLPDNVDELITLLEKRGREHFPKITDDLLTKAAKLLVEDRRGAPIPKPGQAEFLDLLRAVQKLADQKVDTAENLLGRVAEYTLKKHTNPVG